MNAFARALDRLFAHRDLSHAALYRSQGAGDGVPCRVILRQPDEMSDFGGSPMVRATTLIDVRVAEVAKPREGDTFDLAAGVYSVLGVPRRDPDRLTWTCGCRGG